RRSRTTRGPVPWETAKTPRTCFLSARELAPPNRLTDYQPTGRPMSRSYSNRLPQLGGGLFLTDGGIETTLIFHEGIDLPYFAAFHLMKSPEGRAALVRYFEQYVAIARADGTG